MYEFASCLAITIICYALAIVMKNAEVVKDKYIPVILLTVGVVLGVIAFLTGMPSYPATDIITAIAVGAYSALMAVGVNQVGKQLLKIE